MIKGRPILSKEIILSKITTEDIFREYCSPFNKIGEHFSSELRDDKNPSCSIDWIRGDLLYADFGEGLKIRAIDYVMHKFGLTYWDALEKIYNDFKLENANDKFSNFHINNRSISSVNKNYAVVNRKQPTIIRIKKRVDTTQKIIYRPTDLSYWEDFYWTEWMLRESKTWAISHFFLNNYKTNYEDKVYTVGNERAFAYDYYWHDGTMRRKLYFPDRKENKWISNVDDTIVQLVDVAPKTGDILFITSSKKDAGIFWRMQLESMFPDLIVHGVAPNSESAFVPAKWLSKMKTRWKRIIIWYDNDWKSKDNPGVRHAKKFSEMYGLEYYYNPDNTPKDPSDFSKENSLLDFRNLVDIKLNK